MYRILKNGRDIKSLGSYEDRIEAVDYARELAHGMKEHAGNGRVKNLKDGAECKCDLGYFAFTVAAVA